MLCFVKAPWFVVLYVKYKFWEKKKKRLGKPLLLLQKNEGERISIYEKLLRVLLYTKNVNKLCPNNKKNIKHS